VEEEKFTARAKIHKEGFGILGVGYSGITSIL